MAQTKRTITRRGGRVDRVTGTSAADTEQTVSTTADQCRKLLFVAVAYSASPTQTGVTVTLNSGAGAAYDTVLLTGDANAQYTVLIPTSDVIIADDDAIDVTAPGGGGVITSSVSIYTEAV